jgi:hypothetical protein
MANPHTNKGTTLRRKMAKQQPTLDWEERKGSQQHEGAANLHWNGNKNKTN